MPERTKSQPERTKFQANGKNVKIKPEKQYVRTERHKTGGIKGIKVVSKYQIPAKRSFSKISVVSNKIWVKKVQTETQTNMPEGPKSGISTEKGKVDAIKSLANYSMDLSKDSHPNKTSN